MVKKDLTIVISSSDQEEESDYELHDIDVEKINHAHDLSFGVPNIQVIRGFQDWSVLQVSRGVGPRALLQWVEDNYYNCFIQSTFASSSGSKDQECSEHEHESATHKRKWINEAQPVLASPHYSAYAISLVLVARTAGILKELRSVTVTVHCLVKGYYQPRNEIVCESNIDGSVFRTRATSLATGHSNAAG